MGCGSSKATTVAEGANAPESAPTQVQVAPAVGKKAPAGSPAKSGKGKKIITEGTNGGEAVAANGANADANLSVVGSGPGKKGKAEEADSDDADSRMVSASSTRSAPSILERPSSRGGAAFEIQVRMQSRVWWRGETTSLTPQGGREAAPVVSGRGGVFVFGVASC